MAGKKGNRNAVKHGIYSKHITQVDSDQLETMKQDSNTDELALARSRLADAINRRDTAQDEDMRLKWDYAARHWTEIIDGMIARNIQKGETETTIFQSLLDAVRTANDKQHVKR